MSHVVNKKHDDSINCTTILVITNISMKKILNIFFINSIIHQLIMTYDCLWKYHEDKLKNVCNRESFIQFIKVISNPEYLSSFIQIESLWVCGKLKKINNYVIDNIMIEIIEKLFYIYRRNYEKIKDIVNLPPLQVYAAIYRLVIILTNGCKCTYVGQSTQPMRE